MVHAAVCRGEDDSHAREEIVLHVPQAIVLQHAQLVRKDLARYQGAGGQDQGGPGGVEADGGGERNVSQLEHWETFSLYQRITIYSSF